MSYHGTDKLQALKTMLSAISSAMVGRVSLDWQIVANDPHNPTTPIETVPAYPKIVRKP